MCFKYERTQCTCQVATEDVEVWKALSLDNFAYIRYALGVDKYLYRVNEVTEKIELYRENTLFYIHNAEFSKGYHSCASLNKCINYIWRLGWCSVDGRAVFMRPPIKFQKFIIPKGTYYIKNSNGEIISETIMMVDEPGLICNEEGELKLLHGKD